MAKTESGSISIVSTGVDTLILNDSSIVITDVVLFVNNSSSERCSGWSNVTTTYTGNAGTYTDSNTSKTITFYRNIGGVKTKVFETIVTNLDIGEFSINTTTLSSTTSLGFIAHGN